MLCQRSRSENRNTSKALRSRISCAVLWAGEKQRKVALSTACLEGEGRWTSCAGCLFMRGRPMVGKGRQQRTMRGCAPPPLDQPKPWLGSLALPLPYGSEPQPECSSQTKLGGCLVNQSTDEKEQRSQKQFSSVFHCQPTKQRRKECIWHYKNCNLGL